MPSMNDIREIKRELDIDPADPTEDVKLNFFIEQASRWIENLIDRPGLYLKQRTEFYGGTGTQKLLLKSRPVYTTPTIQVFVDESAYYGSAQGSFSQPSLVYGQHFALQIDQDDGTSRSGILVRINEYWLKPQIRQAGLLTPFVGPAFGNIKVVYTAGYTVESLPATFRLATLLIVARLRVLLPWGMIMNHQSYEELSVGFIPKDLLNEVRSLIMPYRNWSF